MRRLANRTVGVRTDKILNTISIIAICGYVFLSYLLVDDDLIVMACFAIALVAAVWQTGWNPTVYISMHSLIWIFFLFYSCVTVQNVVDGRFYTGIAATVLLLCIKMTLENRRDTWPKLLLRVSAVLSLVFVVTTLMQAVLPGIIGAINAKILSPEQLGVNAKLLTSGAHAGITGQTGTNAFNIAIGIGVLGCAYLINRKNRIGMLALILASLLALVMTNKRGQLLALLIAAFVVVALCNRFVYKTGYKTGVAVFGALIAASALITVAPVFQSLITKFTQGGLSGREELWEMMIRFFTDHPLHGIGYGQFSLLTSFSAHNEYLRILCETGIIGFTLYISAALYSIVSLMRAFALKAWNLYHSGSSDLLIYALFSLYMQVFSLIYAISGNPLSEKNQLMWYFVSVAVGMWWKRSVRDTALNEQSLSHRM